MRLFISKSIPTVNVRQGCFGYNNGNGNHEISFTELVAINSDQCAVKIAGIDPDNLWGYTLKAQLENKSAQKTFMFSVESASVNGVKTVPLFAEDKAVKYVREAQSTDQVIADNDSVTVTVIGYEENDIWGYTVKLFLLNKTDKDVMFSADTKDAESVSIPKDEYDLMVDDLLTMSEIIQCVADMRTQDMKAIHKFVKFIPAFATFEKNRLSLYREAEKEAEEIFDRWADRVDEEDEDDYEPDEFFSD